MYHVNCLEETAFVRSREKRKTKWKGLGSISRFHCFELANHKAHPIHVRMIQSCAEFSEEGLVALILLLAPVVIALNSSHASRSCDRGDPQNMHQGVFVCLCMYCMQVGRFLHIQSSCVCLRLALRLLYDLRCKRVEKTLSNKHMKTSPSFKHHSGL